MGAILVVGAFWGDEWKGGSSALINFIFESLMCLRGTGGSGAEHGGDINGIYLKTNQFPFGFILQGCPIGIGPGTAVNVAKLITEVKRFGLKPYIDVLVDHNCPIITQEDIDEENSKDIFRYIGGTKSGSGVALAHAVLRTGPIARDTKELKPFLADISSIANTLSDKGNIVIEASQGAMLSRFFGEYPFVTAGDVTACSAAAGVGLDWRKIDKVVLAVKALPTREGTGPMGNVKELTLEYMKEHNLAENSSILEPATGSPRIRRKTEGIDWAILEKSAMLNGATDIALSFVEHYDPEVKDATMWTDITSKVKGLINKVEKTTNAPVRLLNTGKALTSAIAINGWKLPKITNETMKRLQSYL